MSGTDFAYRYVLIHERWRHHPMIAFLPFQSIRFSDKIDYDVFFPDCVPPLVVSLHIWKYHDCSDSIVRSINKVQETRKNHVAIIETMTPGIEALETIQEEIMPGPTRLFISHNPRDTAGIIKSAYTYMRDTEKLKMQLAYFEHEKRMLTSSERAEKIITTALSKLKIPPSDIELLLEGFPSIAILLNANREDFEENCPVDIESINKLTAFTEA